MNRKTSNALARLDAILPLLSGLQSLGSEDAALYCTLLNSYVQRGRTLTRIEVDERVGNAVLALDSLVNSKLIVLDADGNPAGAYPFTSQQRAHKVHINGVTVHCMCALDALAVSPMFNMPAVIDSECGVSGKEIHVEQNGISLDKGTLDAWLGINWGAARHDIACAESLCLEMMFLANETVAKEWLQESPETREIFDLSSAVDLSAAFFVPLAEHCRKS
jgi:mercuric reductase